MSRILLLIFALCCSSLSFSSSNINSQKNLNFIAISDIHFDPFIGCHLKKYCNTVSQINNTPIQQWDQLLLQNKGQQKTNFLIGQDSNHALFNKLLLKLKQQSNRNKPAFVVITGDFLAHHYQENYRRYFGTLKGYSIFVRHTFNYLYQHLKTPLPNNTPLYFVMGNNDGYLGDYVINVDQTFFKDISKDWPELNRIKHSKTMLNSALLDRNGNYALSTNPNLRLIFLNTNLFHKKSTGHHKETHANLTIRWLEQQLATAKKQKQQVLLFYHIPFGVSPSKRFLSQDKAALWLPEFNKRYIALEKKYRANILAMIHGHVHRKVFMKFHIAHQQPMPQYLVESVSPVFGNSPSFTEFKLVNNKLFLKQVFF